MRIQLTVLRHTLPPTRILWTASHRSPPNTGLNFGGLASGTISQLLEDVNEVVPLESEEWGLEDYAVEVGGYECLHFQEVGLVLKEGDEVTIRALQTSDLRVRRLGGRHQITSDGRHLIDGVAFGRPYLRKSQRPSVDIPPRKKRRMLDDCDQERGSRAYNAAAKSILSDEMLAEVDDLKRLLFGETAPTDDSTDSNPERGVVLQEDFEDADNDEDEDFVDANEDEGEDMDETEELEHDELQALHEDEQAWSIAQNSATMAANIEDVTRMPLPEEQALFDRMIQGGSTESNRKRKRLSVDSAKSVRFEPDPSDNSPMSQPIHNIAEQAVSPRKESPPLHGTAIAKGDVSVDATSESDSETSDSDETSESESSDSSDDDDNDNDNDNDNESDSDSGSFSPEDETTDESDTDSSSSEKEEEEEHRLIDNANIATPNGLRTPASSKPQNSPEKTPGSDTARQHKKLHPDGVGSKPAPPGKGLKATKQNNERQKRRKRLQHLKEQGLLPVNANFKDLEAWDATDGSTSLKPLGIDASADQDMVFETKRQQLLQDIASGGVEVDDGNAKSVDDIDAVPDYQIESVEITEEPKAGMIPATREPDIGPQTMSEPPRKRTKLDIASSRRMLFGSLGVKAPKTKADEEETRRKLAELAHRATPKKTLKIEDSTHTAPTPGAPQEAEAVASTENWQEKITLRAVECTIEGMELSAPSFPFVNIWDHNAQEVVKQLQNRSKSRNKRKRRNADQYYDHGDYNEGTWVEQDVVQELNYDEDQDHYNSKLDDSGEFNGAIRDQIMRENDDIAALAPEGLDLQKICPNCRRI